MEGVTFLAVPSWVAWVVGVFFVAILGWTISDRVKIGETMAGVRERLARIETSVKALLKREDRD